MIGRPKGRVAGSKRSSREAYNDYYRVYMRKYRKKQGGGLMVRPIGSGKKPKHRNKLLHELRRRRIALGYRQKELSTEAGLAANAVELYENMRSDPGFSKFEALVGTLGGRVEIVWEVQ